MSLPARRTATVLGLAALAAIATAAPASAERDVHVDQRGDVVSLAPEAGYDTLPDRTDPDVLRTRVDHGPRNLVIRVKVDDLTSELGHLVSGVVRTPDGTAEFGWGARPDRPLRGGLVRADGSRCATPDPAIDLERDVVRVVISRACLGDPAWVRVGVGVGSYSSLEQDLHFDDARADGFSVPYVVGPRLAAG